MTSTIDSTRWGFGATPRDGGVDFALWAPGRRAELRLEGDESETSARAMKPDAEGMHRLRVEGAGPGARYRFVLDSQLELPDPASRWQPEGVFGPSEVVDEGAYRWRCDAWQPPTLEQLSIYELHVGTFTPEGSYRAAAEQLPAIAELGVTAIELMPLHDFPGARNWGYDPAALWAPSRAYGHPDELRALVDRAHELGLAVLIDVVYNHLGPAGAYVAACGPYLIDHHQTPWGPAVNLDGEHRAGVRAFIIDNALYWLESFRADGLRLDATYALIDDSEPHLLRELSARVAALPGPKRLLIAEDERNLPALAEPSERGGYGLDGLWADDFHHLVRRLVAGDAHGYYADYPVSTAALADCLERGWYYIGQHSRHLDKPRGEDPKGRLAPAQLVACIQNHDQIGNRPAGDRLHHTIDAAAYRAISALLLLAPTTPLLFMGQEWATTSPFIYFTDHDAELGRAVSEGRRRELGAFPGFAGEVPDPQAAETFEASVLDWAERERAPHAAVLALYRDLFALRRQLPSAPCRAEGHEDRLRMTRGRYVLDVLFAGPRRFAAPAADARLAWQSEQPAYTDDPSPARLGEPTAGALQVAVERPAALLWELPR